MSKPRKNLSSLLLAVAASMMLILSGMPVSAAHAGPEVTPAEGTATSIQINQTKNLAVGYSKPLVLKALPEGSDVPEVTWTSSDAAKATVSEDGIVTGVAPGTVTITATSKADASITSSVDLLVRSSYRYNVEWSGTFNAANNNQTTTSNLPETPEEAQEAWQVSGVGNSATVIVDGYIYTYDGTSMSGSLTNQGTLWKIDKKTGAAEKALVCDASTSYWYSYIAYGGGLLYAGCYNKVLAIDPDSLDLLWEASVPGKQYQPVQYVNGCVLANGTVLNATTGRLVTTLAGNYEYSSGVEVGGFYYIAGGDGKLRSYNTTTWELVDSMEFRTTPVGNQPGVMHSNGYLFWGEVSGGKLYRVTLGSQGAINASSLKSANVGISTVCTPVEHNGRVYLPGTRYEKSGVYEKSFGVVCVVDVGTMTLAYTAEGASQKVQSTPILKKPSDGSVIAGAGEDGEEASLAANTAANDAVRVYVQDYGYPSKVYTLTDSAGTTSGQLSALVTIEPQEYAYEQIACDKEGALYCTNDKGSLVKYAKGATSTAVRPTFTTDLSTDEVVYTVGSQANPLSIAVDESPEGSLAYKWQSRTETGAWADIDDEDGTSIIPPTSKIGTLYYRCVVTRTLGTASATATSKAAKITVSEQGSSSAKGDVNGDGSVDARDVTYLSRALAGWGGYSVDSDAADVNGDGSVDARDGTYLKRYLSGWEGYSL